MRKVIIISPWLWTHGDKVGMPTVYYTAIGFAKKGYDTHLVIGSNKETKSFFYDGVTIHHCKVNVSKGTFDAFNSIFENQYGKVEFQKIKRLWKNAIISFLEENSLTKNADLVYLISPMSCLLADNFRGLKQVWRFMGVNVINSETGKISLSSVKSHPIEYLSFKKLSEISKKINPFIVITDDGTRGNKLIEVMQMNYADFLFLKNGVEDFRNISIEPKNALQDKYLHVYDYLSKLKSQGIKIVISTNRFAEWKRNDLVLKTLEKLVAERGRKDLVFLFIGGGPQLNVIKERANSTVGDMAIFLGPVERFTMSFWFRLSDIYISMMDLGQLGNSTFEACLYGLAPVLRNNGDTSLFFDKSSAMLVKDSDEAVDAIEYLIDNPNVRVSLGREASNLVLQKLGTWENRIETEIMWLEKQI